MRPAAEICLTSQFFCQVSALNALTSLTNENARHILDQSAKGVLSRGSTRLSSFKYGRSFVSSGGQNFRRNATGKATLMNLYKLNINEDGQAVAPKAWSKRNFSANAGQDPGYSSPDRPNYERPSYERPTYDTVPRRTPDLEARMRMKANRREAIEARHAMEQEDYVPDLTNMLTKGAPKTYQGIVRDVISVGYFVTMPNSNKEGFLPGKDIGIVGSTAALEKVWKAGDEITVRIVPCWDPGARHLLSVHVAQPNEQPHGIAPRKRVENEGRK